MEEHDTREAFGRTYWRSPSAVEGKLSELSPGAVAEPEFRLLAENIPTLCWIANGDGYIVWYNRRWHEYCGTTPEEMEGWGWQSVHDPELLPSVMKRWTSSVATGQPFEMTFPLRGADGIYRPFLTRIQPLRDAEGKVIRWFGVNTEIGDQLAAENALRVERDRSRSILENMGDAFILLDHQFRVLDINAAGMRLENRLRSSIIGRSHWEVWPGTEDTELGRLYKRAIGERVPVALEHYYEWPDGRRAWLDMRAYPTEHGLAIFYRDITERKRSEEHQRLLINELNHRVKNTLAVVQGIAYQTFKGMSVAPEAREAFEARLAALSRTHNLLTTKSWEAAPLKQVVAETVGAIRSVDGRTIIEGPEVLLPPETAVSFAMAVHELATNAAKYGSLSVVAGQVEVRWELRGGRVHFVWEESGGPPVEIPRVRGFGTRMIERGLAAELNGQVTIDFRVAGLVCTVDAPVPEAQQ